MSSVGGSPRARRPEWPCPRCGYELAGLADAVAINPVCPECALPVRAPVHAPDAAVRGVGIMLGAMCGDVLSVVVRIPLAGLRQDSEPIASPLLFGAAILAHAAGLSLALPALARTAGLGRRAAVVGVVAGWVSAVAMALICVGSAGVAMFEGFELDARGGRWLVVLIAPAWFLRTWITLGVFDLSLLAMRRTGPDVRLLVRIGSVSAVIAATAALLFGAGELGGIDLRVLTPVGAIGVLGGGGMWCACWLGLTFSMLGWAGPEVKAAMPADRVDEE